MLFSPLFIDDKVQNSILLQNLIAKCLRAFKLSFPSKSLLIVLVTNNKIALKTIMSEVRLYK